MRKEEFYYPSMDGIHNIHAVAYIPDEIEAIVQIVHGMQEYILRYEDFALWLNERNIMVVGEDHLGHGLSVNGEEDYGYFGDEGNRFVIGDLRQLQLLTTEKYDIYPYYFLGHSMGSFLLRQYIQNYYDIDGAIIVGSGYKEEAALKAGKALASALIKVKGDRYRSDLIKKIAFGTYNVKTEKRTDVDWISASHTNIDRYIADELCGIDFTLNGYLELFKAIEDEQNENNLIKMPADLPVIFLAGQDDPVGDYGKGVLRSYTIFKNIGMEDVEIKLYPDMRHEILNEDNKEEVYEDIYNWLIKHIDAMQEE